VVTEIAAPVPKEVRRPVLAIGLGRGGGGKSTVLAELVWRAEAQGRRVIVADGDTRSKTLTGLFPDAMRPETEEMPDIKAFLTGLLNRMAKEQKSAVLDLGGGDRALLELGRDLRLVEFCARRGIEPLAIFCLGPDTEDLSHIYSIFEAGYFRPERMILFLNEGVIRNGQTVAGAFNERLDDERFGEIVTAGAKPILLTRLACMNLVRASSAGFYRAAAGAAGLDPVEEFMIEDWLSALEAARHGVGVSEWLP
jgi:hypothetical protein